MPYSLTAMVDPRPLGLSRIMVGAAALVRSLVAIPILVRLSDPDTLKAPNFSWFPAPSPPVIWILIVVWLVTAGLFMLGWRARVTGTILTLVIVFVIALDRQTYSNHLYLMAWLTALLVLADAGAGLSVMGQRRPIVFWPVILLSLQITIVYLFSALTKVNDSFLSGEVLAGVLRGGLVPFPETLRTPQILAPLAAAVIVIEVFIALGLWVVRWRPWAILLGVCLHFGITLLMAAPGELLVFSLEMLAIYPLYMYGATVNLDRGSDCRKCDRSVEILRRTDILGVINSPFEYPSSGDAGMPHRHLRSSHRGEMTDDFRALQRATEHVVPGIWFGPFLRIPGLHGVAKWLWSRGHTSIENT